MTTNNSNTTNDYASRRITSMTVREVADRRVAEAEQTLSIFAAVASTARVSAFALLRIMHLFDTQYKNINNK